jgi:transposase-like protein
MSKERRVFSPEEKHSILQEAEREGVTETCRKYNLAHSVISYWRKKYLTKGKQGLTRDYNKEDPRVKQLESENEKLKRIISKQALEIEVKDEIIKKGNAHLQKKGRL